MKPKQLGELNVMYIYTCWVHGREWNAKAYNVWPYMSRCVGVWVCVCVLESTELFNFSHLSQFKQSVKFNRFSYESRLLLFSFNATGFPLWCGVVIVALWLLNFIIIFLHNFSRCAECAWFFVGHSNES